MAASAVYLPLDFAKTPCDDLDGYRNRLDQPRPLTRKEAAERVEQVLKRGEPALRSKVL